MWRRWGLDPAGTTLLTTPEQQGSDFDPSFGLEQLRELITTAAPDEGIEVAGDVGVTSHAGDLLRRAAIPSRLVEAREG